MTSIITRKKTTSYVIKKSFFFMNFSAYFAFQGLVQKYISRDHLVRKAKFLFFVLATMSV